MQFEFLVAEGLREENYLLDIACGSLRLGVKAIPYLLPGHYFGIEKEPSLIKAGLEKEIDQSLLKIKSPNIVISDSFEFEKFGRKVNFAIAQSLFTHLPSEPIKTCFKKLYPWLENDGVFYATYFETENKRKNPRKPHDHRYFGYTRSEMEYFGELNHFAFKYIGKWNHPRNQVIVQYKKQ